MRLPGSSRALSASAARCFHVPCPALSSVRLPDVRAVSTLRGDAKPLVVPTILDRGPGYLVLQKPAGLCLRRSKEEQEEPSVEAWLRETMELSHISFPQAQGQMDALPSGALFVATSRSVADEVFGLRRTQRFAEVYTAIVRGRMVLQDLITCRARLCRPSEGSEAMRLSGSRTEGSAACTLVRGLCHGTYGGEPCTLVELRPVTGHKQQLQLHCVALGHPVVGDTMHDADRRLDFRFDAPLPAPRVLLHCERLTVPMAGHRVAVVAADPLEMLLSDVVPAEADSGLDLATDNAVEGLTNALRTPNAWEVFVGGQSEVDSDGSCLDEPLPRLRPVWSAPYGPPEWDDRAQKLSEKMANREGHTSAA